MINGFGIGTDHFGGFSEKASVRHEWLMPLPSGLSHLEAAKIGTAGYTAMLCVDAIKQGKMKIKLYFVSNHIFLGPLVLLSYDFKLMKLNALHTHFQEEFCQVMGRF